jgi:hypothetical protein
MRRNRPKRGNPTVQCTICKHVECHRIELALVSGASAAAVAKKYSVSADAARRHLRNHVSGERRAQLVAGPLKLHELAERASESDLALVDYLAMLRNALFEQFLQATQAGDRNGSAALAGRLTEVLRLQGSVSGEISKATTVINNNAVILSSPLFADLQAMLVQTLTPHPEALRDVLAGLERLSVGSRAPATQRPAIEHQPAVTP